MSIKQRLLNFFVPPHKPPVPDLTFGVQRSRNWSALRNSFVKNNSQCAFCNTTKDLEVHHVVPVHLNPGLELDISNLITLCSHDHYVIGHFCSWYSHNATVRGDCAEFRFRIEHRPQ